ncbi:hypothetical protein N5923_05745 [Erwiniaceae bacterium BAC15a-03b]|uniref:Uncharacterized protein n=1 Tax=Winslowiella arboricola TaxID=2978220 RepID=A0A9J6PKK1_9GAMM|nr:hypothetical protein [Winslowiella arboricola]MCU5774072.1 hypothetical protein [Winslowiella arboricola]MCU5776995.1 hypothetical protein [Winslowiella arboricola]
MKNALRAPLVWGIVCFLLLYRTLPADMIMSWQISQQYSVPLSNLLLTILSQLLPALTPLACFVWLVRHLSTGLWLALIAPVVAWFAIQLIIAAVFYFVAVKSGSIPPYEEGFVTVLRRMLDIQWIAAMLVTVLTIMASSYACWRETRWG